MYFVWLLWVESHKNYEISQMLELCEEEFRKSVQGYLLQANDCTYKTSKLLQFSSQDDEHRLPAFLQVI